MASERAWRLIAPIDPRRGLARGSCASLPTRRAIIAGQGGVAVAPSCVSRPTADPADLGDDAVSASERAVVVAALNRLDAVDRLVIALRHFEQLSEQEMAEVLDVPPGTVKSRLCGQWRSCEPDWPWRCLAMADVRLDDDRLAIVLASIGEHLVVDGVAAVAPAPKETRPRWRPLLVAALTSP